MRTMRSTLANILLIGAAGLVAVDARAAEFIVKATTVTEMKAVYGQVESRTILPARARISGTVSSIRVTEGA
ncbi:efflux transporter periplasmic adaptor subunit, partial [Mesorhizobium sp. M2E.F.Ca.ET.154.01.1.1]